MPGDVGNGAQPGYDAFISYSHAVDGKLAPSLQTALQRFAKPWYRLRAMRVFRDQTILRRASAPYSMSTDACCEDGGAADTDRRRPSLEQKFAFLDSSSFLNPTKSDLASMGELLCQVVPKRRTSPR
jgi:hypothetical protein